MPLTQADVELRISGGSSSTNTNRNLSLGGFMSTVNAGIILTDEMNNLWDDISGTQILNGSTEYRCIYANNKSTQFTWRNVRMWISQVTPSSTEEISIAVGLRPAAIISSTIANYEQSLSSETATPSGLTFSTPTTSTNGLVLGNIPPSQHKGIWLRRVCQPNTSFAIDNFYVLRLEGADQ